MNSKMDDLLAEVRDYAEEMRERISGGEDLYDLAHEIADASTPIYTGELMELAAENTSLAVAEPELGPAFDGSPTPVNIVAANVYEMLHAEAVEHLEVLAAELRDEYQRLYEESVKTLQGQVPETTEDQEEEEE